MHKFKRFIGPDNLWWMYTSENTEGLVLSPLVFDSHIQKWILLWCGNDDGYVGIPKILEFGSLQSEYFFW